MKTSPVLFLVLCWSYLGCRVPFLNGVAGAGDYGRAGAWQGHPRRATVAAQERAAAHCCNADVCLEATVTLVDWVQGEGRGQGPAGARTASAV